MGRRPDQASDFAYKAKRLSSGTNVGSRIQQLTAHSGKLTAQSSSPTKKLTDSLLLQKQVMKRLF